MQRIKMPELSRISLDQTMTWIVSVSVFLFPITILTINRADSAILLLFGLIGVFTLLRFGIKDISLSKQEVTLILLLVGWYAVIVIFYFIGDRTDTGFKMIGRYLRLLFFIPAYIACRRYLLNIRPVFISLVMAPVFILGLGIWQFLHAHQDIRVRGFVDTIPFGDLSMAMAFMALSFLLIVERKHAVLQYLLAGAALVSGVITSVLSGARGGWLALPVLLLITVIALSRRSGKRAIKVLIICAVFVMLASFLAPQEIIKNRVAEAVGSLEKYVDYVRLIKLHDVEHKGCLNDRIFMDSLVTQLRAKNHGDLEFSVIDDQENIASSGLSNLCKSGYVVKVVNLNKDKDGTFFVERSLISATGKQSAEFMIRNKGMIGLIHGYKKDWEKFDNQNYRLVHHTQDVKDLSWPVILVPKGATLYFVPIQNQNGEYVFPLANNPVGNRLEMWRVAWHVFVAHPLLGAGTGSFLDQSGIDAKLGRISPAVARYDHPHNDYLNAMASQGLIGLLFYVLSLLYPMMLFIRKLNSDDIQKRAASFAGLVMISGLLIFGLTETMFIHSIVMSWYVVFLAILCAGISTNEYKS